MKRLQLYCLWFIALNLAAPLLAPAAESVSASDSLFTSSGDIDGDGDADAIIVERDTGLVLIGVRQSDDRLAFRRPVLSGIPDVTGMAVGRFHSATRDSLALTSPLSNRVQLLDPLSPTLQPQTASFPAAGPRLLAPFDIAGIGTTGLEDLSLAAGFEAMLPLSVRSLANAGDGSFEPRPEESVASELLGWRPVSTARIGGAARIAYIEDSLPDPIFKLVTPTSTDLVSHVGIPVDPSYLEFIHGQFDANESDFIFYSPGSAFVRVRRLQPGGSSFDAEESWLISGGVQQMVRLKRPGADHILVIDNSKQVRIFSYDSTTGFTLVEQLSHGLQSTRAVIAFDDGGFAVLTGSGFSGPTENFSVYNELAAGSYKTLQFVTALPSLDQGPARGGNLFLFSGQPLIDENPSLVAVLSVDDWSSDLQLPLGGGDSAIGETFFGGITGLGDPTLRPISPLPKGTLGGLANQHQTDISFSSLGDSAVVLGNRSAGVDFEPAGGSQEDAIQVTIRAEETAATIFYRLDETSPFATYSAPFWIFEDTLVQAYAIPSDGSRTPVAAASYTFTRQPEDQDLDDDGVPDFVELEQMLDPSDGADSDGDGSSDLAEILVGTDPLDPGDFPESPGLSGVSGKLFVNITPLPWDGSSNSAVAAQTGVPIAIHDVSGALLGTGRIDQPLALPAARFACDPFEPGLRYLVVSTPAHYNIQSTGTDLRVGREMIGLIPAPEPAHLTWTTETVDALDNAGRYASLAISPAGHPAISYLRSTNPPFNGTLQFAEYGPGGWSITEVDSDPATSGNGFYSSLAYTPSGDPAISYLEGTPNNNLRYASRTAGSWTIETVDAPASGAVGRWTSLAMLPDGSPAIAYQENLSRDVKYAFHDGSTWHKWTAASEGDLGTYNSLAIDPASGEPVITTFETASSSAGGSPTDRLEFLEFSGVGALFDRQTVADNLADPPQYVGRGSSLAFDPLTGHPVVSYGGLNLWLAKWDGAAWQLSEVADGPTLETSLAFHPVTGQPAIAFNQTVDDDLMLATFNGSTWSTEVIDSGGNVGEHVSLAYAPDGTAHIAYYDLTNTALKHAFQTFVPGAAEADFTYDPLANPADEAARWVAAFAEADQANAPQTVNYDLTVDEVLAFLLVETRLGELMFQRGVGSTGSAPSFTPFRPSEISGDFFSPIITTDQLLALETVPPFSSPEFTSAIRLREFLAGVIAMLQDPVSDPALGHLKTLVREVYRISGLYHNASPSSYPPPFDALRTFIQWGTLDPAYSVELVGLDTNDLSAINNFVFQLRYGNTFLRPKLDRSALHSVGDPPDGKTYARAWSGSETWELRDADGDPFEMPEAFALSDGSPFRLIAFDDLDPSADPTPVEVIAIQLTGVALPSPTDLDGNLLPDAWEELFFGKTGNDAHQSADASGYSSLQQYFEGTDPTDPFDLPPVSPVTFDFGAVSGNLPQSDNFEIRFTWPQAYEDEFDFIVQASTDLEDFNPVPATIYNLGGSQYSAEVDLTGSPDAQFFRVTVRLSMSP